MNIVRHSQFHPIICSARQIWKNEVFWSVRLYFVFLLNSHNIQSPRRTIASPRPHWPWIQGVDNFRKIINYYIILINHHFLLTKNFQVESPLTLTTCSDFAIFVSRQFFVLLLTDFKWIFIRKIYCHLVFWRIQEFFKQYGLIVHFSGINLVILFAQFLLNWHVYEKA